MRLLQRDENAEYLLKRIKDFPQELAHVYRNVLQGIASYEVGLALRLFEWLTLSQRPLMTEELQVAVCLDEQQSYKSTKQLQKSEHFCGCEKQHH